MEQPLNATGKDTWKGSPHIRNAYRTLVPLADNSPWSAALGPAHLPWLFMDNPPEHWPAPTLPDVWIIYRTNPAVSNWETGRIERELERFPFVAAFAYTQDETNWYADLLLPEATDLESLQLYRVGGTKYIEQYWQHTGWALRQPAAASPCDVRDLTDIATELAARTGLLKEYLAALNRGSGTTVPLKGVGYDYSVSTAPRGPRGGGDLGPRLPRGDALADRRRRGARPRVVQAPRRLLRAVRDEAVLPPLDHGRPRACATSCPTRSASSAWARSWARASTSGRSSGGTSSSTSTSRCPSGRTSRESGWARRTINGKDGRDFPFWLLTSRSMQYSWGSNVSLPIMADVARHVRGHFGVMLNRGAARRLGIAEGDLIEVESPTGKTQGRAILREGVRPDVAVILQQFGHWATPFARDLEMPNLNQVASMDLALTDATGSGADLVPVAIRRASGAMAELPQARASRGERPLQ